MKTQTIGVEIEMTGLTRKAVAEILAAHFGTAANYVDGGYKAYEVKDAEDRTWKVMRDTSITSQKKVREIITYADELYRVELVTPILKYNDIETLQEIVRKIRKAGGFVNKSCGLHIHIGAEKFTPATIRNLVNAVASKEELIYKALKVHEDRKSYCKPTDKRFLQELNEKKPETMAQLAAIWYNEPEELAATLHNHYDSTRYTICNLHALFTKGTIEFRVFNSTLHAGEIKAYIQFCLALTHQALTTKKAIYRPTETDNEKYTFRCWLLRLNLNGEEFKTCRLHLLKNLTGDAAWRRAEATA
ncbi:MAG: amidoligase family protein [Selenomonadaceae bacterium]|nr:amidoligase family protein [Selenomonadaceae bacterium]